MDIVKSGLWQDKTAQTFLTGLHRVLTIARKVLRFTYQSLRS